MGVDENIHQHDHQHHFIPYDPQKMKRIIDEEIKTIWYHTDSNGFPTYLAIESYRKQSPSYTHSIASKKTWEELTKNQKKYGLGNPKNIKS